MHPLPRRIHPPFCLFLSLLFSCAFPSLFFGQDGTAVDLKSLSAYLETIKEKQSAAISSRRNAIYQDFRAASQDTGAALAFYEEAMRNTAFLGQNREQTEFHDWKKKQAEKFKDPTFLNAIRLELAYIVLTLERGNGVTVKKIMPELLAYLGDAQSAGQSLKAPEMRKDVTGSIFVEWYQIHDWVSAADSWDMRPGDINGIYEQTILPELRQEKDPRILQYWDQRIDTEAQNADASKLTFEVDKFNQITRPSLLWARAKDQMAIGQRNNAMNSMFAIIKANPDHPSSADWINELQGIVRSMTPAPAPTGNAPAAAAAQGVAPH